MHSQSGFRDSPKWQSFNIILRGALPRKGRTFHTPERKLDFYHGSYCQVMGQIHEVCLWKCLKFCFTVFSSFVLLLWKSWVTMKCVCHVLNLGLMFFFLWFPVALLAVILEKLINKVNTLLTNRPWRLTRPSFKEMNCWNVSISGNIV